MGFFDSLFGSGKKSASKKKKKATTAPVMEAVEPAPAHNGLSPEVLAAVSSSINMVLAEETDAAIVAAVTATIMHAHRGGAKAVKFDRTSNSWSLAGRQKIMDARL